MHLPTPHVDHSVVVTPNPFMFVFLLVESVFWSLAAGGLLLSLFRVGNALKLQGRVKALDEFGDAYTAQERERVIHKIKVRSLSSL